MPFIVDDQTSWPLGVAAALHNALPMLRGYQEHRKRIVREREDNPDDIMLRIHPSRNPHRTARDDLIADVDAQIAGLAVMAWHCTRLCPDEIADVEVAGLSLLSPEMFAARVRRRVDAGEVTEVIADRLRGKNQVYENTRRGQIWFVLTRGLLADDGVADFFRYWGGEALYNSHDRDMETGPVLRALGTPCIVEMEISCAAITAFHSIGITMVRVFELAHGLKDENWAESEGYIRQAVPPENVHRVITVDQADFVALTTAAEPASQ